MRKSASLTVKGCGIARSVESALQAVLLVLLPLRSRLSTFAIGSCCAYTDWDGRLFRNPYSLF